MAATPAVAWSATGSWRGDPKLFGQIAARAVREVGAAQMPDDCKIEFAVREDREVYGSVSDLLERVPYSTTRNFSSCRIEVGGSALLVVVEFGRRKRSAGAAFVCPRGVAVKVSSNGAVTEDTVDGLCAAVSSVVSRGGFSWALDPTEGPVEDGPTLDEVLELRWWLRRGLTQLTFALVSFAVLGGLFVYTILTDQFDNPVSLSVGYIAAVLIVVQLLSYPVSMFIFPAIELADVTPGRRWLKVIGGSGLLSAAVGIGATLLKDQIS